MYHTLTKGDTGICDTGGINENDQVHPNTEPSSRCKAEKPGRAVNILKLVEILLEEKLAAMGTQSCQAD